MVGVSDRTAIAEAQGATPNFETVEEIPIGAASGEVLTIEDLHVTVEGHEILRGVDLVVRDGELHALMGPNGSGKSTLANAIAGNPAYQVASGRILLRGEEITTWTADVRARAGVFLAFQYPEEISGVPVSQFLRQAVSARRGMDISVLEVRVALTEWMQRLDMDPAFASRYLNEGFSGGEKKRNEILQMAMLEPDVAVLDETDSGLDVDALRIVARGIEEVRRVRPALGILVVTHYRRILEQLQPDRVHVMLAGRIVESGGPELAERLDREGYEGLQS
jgi:Fe-S cluster assembly ATP-binding protein